MDWDCYKGVAMRLPLLFLTSLLILSGQAAQASENRLTDNSAYSAEEYLIEEEMSGEESIRDIASPSLQQPVPGGRANNGGIAVAAGTLAADGVAGESANKECGTPSLCGLPQGNDGNMLQDVQEETVNETSQNESLALAQCGEGPQLVQQEIICASASAAEGNTRIASGRGHIKPVAHQRFVASAANGQPNVESAAAQPKPIKKPHPIARKVRAFCSFMAPIVNVTVGVLTILLLLL